MNKNENMNKKESKSSSNIIQRFVLDERGEIGIKQIAATVAVIILIGAVVAVITKGSFLDNSVQWVWKKFTEVIDDTFKT